MFPTKLLVVLLLFGVGCGQSTQKVEQAADFEVQIIRSSGNIMFTTKNNDSREVHSEPARPAICTQSQHIYSEMEQQLTINANKAFNVSVSTEHHIVSANGIGVSMGQGQKHSTEIIVISRCRHLELSMPSYTLSFKFEVSGKQKTIRIPVAMECSSDISNTKIEYVLLQFIVSAIFVLCSFVFTKFVFTAYNIDTLLCSLLCISWAHPILGVVLSVVLTGRILYSLCAIHPGARYRRLMFTYTFSFVIHIVLRTFEIDFPILHLLFNFLMVVGLITIIKITRFRHLLYIWIVVNLSYSAFADQTKDSPEFQMYFPSLFTNRSYACVSSNIMQLALPLCFSLFFTRFSKQSSSARNIYLMMHFIVFLTVGTFSSIMEMKGNPVPEPLLFTLAGIVFISFIVAIAEGNFRRLIQYRVQI